MPNSTDSLRLLHLPCDIILSKPTFAATRHHHSTTIRGPGIIRPTVQVYILPALTTTPQVAQAHQPLHPIPTAVMACPIRYRIVTMEIPVMAIILAFIAPHHNLIFSAHVVPILHSVLPISNSHKRCNNPWIRYVNIITPPTRIVHSFDASLSWVTLYSMSLFFLLAIIWFPFFFFFRFKPIWRFLFLN